MASACTARGPLDRSGPPGRQAPRSILPTGRATDRVAPGVSSQPGEHGPPRSRPRARDGPVTLAEQPRVGLAQSLRAPHKAASPRKAPCSSKYSSASASHHRRLARARLIIIRRPPGSSAVKSSAGSASCTRPARTRSSGDCSEAIALPPPVAQTDRNDPSQGLGGSDLNQAGLAITGNWKSTGGLTVGYRRSAPGSASFALTLDHVVGCPATQHSRMSSHPDHAAPAKRNLRFRQWAIVTTMSHRKAQWASYLPTRPRRSPNHVRNLDARPPRKLPSTTSGRPRISSQQLTLHHQIFNDGASSKVIIVKVDPG